MGEYQANSSGEKRETIHLTSLIEASGKLVLIDKLLPKLKAGGHKVGWLCAQMVHCSWSPRTHIRKRKIDGTASTTTRCQYIRIRKSFFGI